MKSNLAEFDLFEGQVVRRDSRVTVIAAVDGDEFRAHLRNTGRLNRLIYPGSTVLCRWKKTGKTDARVLGAVDGGSVVLLDTYVQERSFEKLVNARALDWLPENLELTNRVSCGEKRFDFGFESDGRSGFIELKSAVTCENGRGSYPDAPSERGLEHVESLTRLSGEGVPVYVVFVLTHPDCGRFRPNYDIQPEMGEALMAARETGVDIYAIKLVLTGEGRVRLVDQDVPVELSSGGSH